MDAVSSYSYASLAWHTLQGVPLVIWPQAINGLLTMDNKTGMMPSSGVDNYFARSLGIALLALGSVTVVLTGALPLNSLVESKSPIRTPCSNPWTHHSLLCASSDMRCTCAKLQSRKYRKHLAVRRRCPPDHHITPRLHCFLLLGQVQRHFTDGVSTRLHGQRYLGVVRNLVFVVRRREGQDLEAYWCGQAHQRMAVSEC